MAGLLVGQASPLFIKDPVSLNPITKVKISYVTKPLNLLAFLKYGKIMSGEKQLFITDEYSSSERV